MHLMSCFVCLDYSQRVQKLNQNKMEQSGAADTFFEGIARFWSWSYIWRLYSNVEDGFEVIVDENIFDEAEIPGDVRRNTKNWICGWWRSSCGCSCRKIFSGKQYINMSEMFKKICYEKHILSCNQSKFLTKRKRKKSQAGVEEVPNMDYKNC